MSESKTFKLPEDCTRHGKKIVFTEHGGEHIVILIPEHGANFQRQVYSKDQAIELASLINTHMGDTEDE